jgi:hypothetical protein
MAVTVGCGVVRIQMVVAELHVLKRAAVYANNVSFRIAQGEGYTP